LFDNSSYVKFQHFTVSPVTIYSSVILRNGSTHITVNNNSITSAAASGIFLGMGCNNIIAYNTIHDVAKDGLVVDKAVCNNGTQTLVYGNTIYNTGVHGIELDGNYFIIDYNIIHDSGITTSGASGIHLYGAVFKARRRMVWGITT
jgi:hypothetical protein